MSSSKEKLETNIWGLLLSFRKKKHDQKMIYKTDNHCPSFQKYNMRNSTTDLISIIHLLLYIFTMAHMNKTIFPRISMAKHSNYGHEYYEYSRVRFVIKSKSSEKEFGIGSEVVGCKLLDQNLESPLAQWFHG